MPSNFVVIRKHNFEEALSEMFSDDWQEITNTLNGTQESVYQVKSDNPNIAIRIYSSIDVRTNESRDIGQDAIRIVIWDCLNDRPMGKTKRIHRTEGATSVYDRIQARIKEFLTETHNIEPVNWDYVRAVLEANSWNDFAQSLLQSLIKYKSLTENQMRYVLGSENVNGRPTLEMRAKRDNSNFFSEWQASQNEAAEQAQFEAMRSDRPITVTNEINPDLIEHNHGDHIMEIIQQSDQVVNEQIRNATRRRARPTSRRYVSRLNPDTALLEDVAELLPTDEYTQWTYPFEYFNPVQSAVFPLMWDDINLVIGASTSAGKTICAEMFMDSTLAAGKKVIYLSPLKSLTQEKYDDWKRRFSDDSIVILTGDYTLSEAMKKKLSKASIIVMTSEMMDSRTRRMKMEQGSWLLNVGLVIVDETHILATDRGHAVESGLMRFSKINNNARIVLLSATMPNVEDLGQWLHQLNGKQTEIINSTWRPVELQISPTGYEVVRSSNGRMLYAATQQNKINLAVQIANSKMEKFLIFVHDKTTGRKLVKALHQTACDAVFHNADLDLNERLDIERSFEDRENGTRVIVSTSTLAWGRNLPARNVIIVGCHRGLDEVHEYDLIQMAGRAGRYGIDDKGFVFLLLPDDSYDYWFQKFQNPRPIQSTLDRPEVLAFHAISEIDIGEIKDPGYLQRWFNRSFASRQSPMSIEQANFTFEQLVEMEMIQVANLPRPKVSGLGKVCSWLYFSPFDVYSWYKNISEVHTNGHLTDNPDMALAYSLSNVPEFDYGYIPKDCQDEVEPLQKILRNQFGYHRLLEGTGAYFLGVLAALEGREKEDTPISALTTGRSIKWDIRRITQAIKLIDSMHADWKLEPIWKTLPLRVQYGVSAEISELCRIPGVGGMRAKKLWNKGFHSIEDVADQNRIKKLRLILQPRLAKKIQAAARDILTEIEE